MSVLSTMKPVRGGLRRLAILAAISLCVAVTPVARPASGVVRSETRKDLTSDSIRNQRKRLEVRECFVSNPKYKGDSSLVSLAQTNAAEPVSISSGDFDEDGVPDLVVGYSATINFFGLYRGDVDSVFPNTADARRRREVTGRRAAPFHAVVNLVELPVVPDLLETGDFSGDGHLDLIMSRGYDGSVWLLAGDGAGRFDQPVSIQIGGLVHAIKAADIGRKDGVIDLIVGVETQSGPELLIYRGPDGALRSTPTEIPLDHPATGFLAAQLDSEPGIDLAIASGNEMLIGYSRLDDNRQEFMFRSHRFDSSIESLASGSFRKTGSTEIAVALEDGGIIAISSTLDSSARVIGLRSGASRLISARSEGQTGFDLLLADIAAKELLFFDHQPEELILSGTEQPNSLIDLGGEPVAILPLRLNPDALDDLVVIRKGFVTPMVLLTPQAIIPVSNLQSTGPGSFADAIDRANTMPGADTITFDIPGAPPFTINLQEPLIPITEAVTIDGTTQPGFAGAPIVEINGAGVGTNGNLVINSPNCTVRGLVWNRFQAAAIVLNAGGNFIERNFIGTNQAGSGVLGNNGPGIQVVSAGNTIGGTAAAARNVISGNAVANIAMPDVKSTGNTIQGNFIGTNAAGTAALFAAGPGISLAGNVVSGPANNLIGGTTAAARNVISGNGSAGIQFTNGGNSNLVQGNFIGSNAAGTGAVPNQSGVGIQASSNNTIGGTVNGAGNVIAFNNTAGVFVNVGMGNSIRGNSIFGNLALGINLVGNDLPSGVTPNDVGDVDVGSNTLQNFPVLVGATSNALATIVVGALNSTPGQFTIDFFSSPVCDPSGFGEGQTPVGSTTIVTDATGNASFTATLSTRVPVGQVITATATSSGNNTSEFSQCVTVSDLTDLSISISATPGPVPNGGAITYTIIVTNTGPGQALSVRVTDLLPPQAVFVSCSSTNNGVCSGTGNDRVITFQFLAPGTSAVITINAQANCANFTGSSIVNSVMVTSATGDANPANNTASATTAGAPQVNATKNVLDTGLAKARFRAKRKNAASDTVVLTSTGCAPLVLTSVRINRVGADVNRGRISNANDAQFFSLNLVGAGGVETPIPIPSPANFSLTIPPGQQGMFRILFTPVIPSVAGSTSGLAASDVLPDSIDSVLMLTTNAGPLDIRVTGRVGTGPRIIDTVALSRSANQMTVTVPVWDANSNVNRIRYRFLNSSGGQVDADVDVDVADAIRARNLTTGQSFVVIVDFTGDNEGVSRVEVTVSDEEGLSDIATSGGGSVAAASVPQSTDRTVQPAVILKRQFPRGSVDIQPVNRSSRKERE